MIGIYKITSPTNRVYIGQSINIQKRFKQYKNLQNVSEQKALHNSFLKYGVDNHTFETLEECTIELLNERERYYQDFYDVINKGLNCFLTNTNEKKRIFSKETKEKMKINHSRFFKGKKLSKTHCENISKGLINHIVTKETKEKISLTRLHRKIKSPRGMLGKIHNQSSKDKISKSLKGNKFSCKIILDINNFIFYNSLKEYAILYGYKPDTFNKRMKKGLHKNIIIT